MHLLTPGDVERAFAAIRDGKTAADVKTGPRGRARVTGGVGTARMAIALLGALDGRCTKGWRLPTLPTCPIGVSGERSTILEDAADYGRLFETLDRMEREQRLRAGRGGRDPPHRVHRRASRRNHRPAVVLRRPQEGCADAAGRGAQDRPHHR